MDETERLTSYLDGELAADELRSVEAELAGDRALQERLEALRAADEALGGLQATALPGGARERLDVRLSGVLEEVLGAGADRDVTALATAADVADHAPTTSEATGRPSDALATRRRWRVGPALTGVAAGLVLLAGGLLGLGQLDLRSGQDSASTDADEMMAADDAGEVAPESASEADGDGTAPVIIDDGRSTSVDELDALLVTAELEELAGRGLQPADGETLAARFQQLLLGGDPGAETGSTGDGDEARDGADSPTGELAGEQTEEQTEEQADEPAEDTHDPDRARTMAVDTAIVTRDGRLLDEGTVSDLRRCLAGLLDGGEQAIPRTVELLSVDGVDAISFGLVTLDPDTDAFTRIEVWTLERSTCQVLRFDQS